MERLVVRMVAGAEVDQVEKNSDRNVHLERRQARGTVACLVDWEVEPFE